MPIATQVENKNKQKMKKVFFSIFFILIAVVGVANVPFGTKLTLTKLNGNNVESTNVYLTIDKEKNTISGKSGCNTFGLDFESKKNNDACIKTGLPIGTMMACDEETMKLEAEFLETIRERKFKVKTKGNKVQFKNWWGKTIMEFEQQTDESVWNFIEKNDWKLIMLNNVGKDYGRASIKLNVKEKSVSGHTGCNGFSGTFESDGNHISFDHMRTTLMACLDEEANQTERIFLDALSGKKLRFDLADQTLNFYDGNRLVMMFGLVK